MAEGYFISNNTYCIVTSDNKVISKAKGVNKNIIKLKDYKNMYEKGEIINSIRTESIKDYEKGYVRIYNVKYKLVPIYPSYTFIWCIMRCMYSYSYN